MRRISHFKLGLFLLTCAAVGAVALIWIGAARIFQKSRTYAAFFDEPVSGLESGAPVKHLGVRIGTLDSVDLAPGDRLVRVMVKIRADFRLGPSMALSVTQAGITGAPFLALDEASAGERRLLNHPATKDPVLPTRSGGGGISGIEKKLASLDIQGVITRWEGVAARMEAILQPSQIQPIVRDLQATTESLKTATAAIAQETSTLRPGTLAAVASRIERTTDLGEKTLRDLDENVGSSVVLVRRDLAQLRQAVVEAQSLARSLRAQPSRLIERGGGSDPFKP